MGIAKGDRHMGSDMVVALKDASANETTLFGLNHHAAIAERHSVQIIPGHFHEPGQLVPIANLALPQVRQTFTVVGLQTQGSWGFNYGVNEHRVAVGATAWQSRLKDCPACFEGCDLVRLALERGRSALAAADVITDLVQRHGLKSDHIYLIADSSEAFVLEACGNYWALLECGHTRVVTGAAMIRQDWRRLAPGLAAQVIEKGWWQDDGSKIDFIGCLGENTESARNAQRRWGRASLTMSQQQGAIDLHFLRHMLGDHFQSNRDLLRSDKASALASSFLADLYRTDMPLVVWLSFGPPQVSLYFPICLAGELPAAFGAAPAMMTTIEDRVQELCKLAQKKDSDTKLTLALERLQTKFDQDADELFARSHEYLAHGKPHLIAIFATEMMANHIELFNREYRRLFGVEEKQAPVENVAEECLFFA
jgi:hypothetical protein